MPAPLSLPPLQLAIGGPVLRTKCTCTTNGISHRRSPSVGYLPAHRRRCPELSSPPTRQQWNAPVNIAVGKAPHHAVCRSGGHLAHFVVLFRPESGRKTAMRLAVPRVIESTDRPHAIFCRRPFIVPSSIITSYIITRQTKSKAGARTVA